MRRKCLKIYQFLEILLNLASIIEGNILRSLRESSLGMKNFSAYIVFLPGLPNTDLKVVLIGISLIDLHINNQAATGTGNRRKL